MGILRGHQRSEAKVTYYKSLIKTDDSEHLFTLLEKGRADVVVTVRIEGLNVIRQAGLKNIRLLHPPLEVIPIYPYLNKKHDGIIGKLDRVLKEMKADGTFHEIRGGILSPYLKSVEGSGD